MEIEFKIYIKAIDNSYAIVTFQKSYRLIKESDFRKCLFELKEHIRSQDMKIIYSKPYFFVTTFRYNKPEGGYIDSYISLNYQNLSEYKIEQFKKQLSEKIFF